AEEPLHVLALVYLARVVRPPVLLTVRPSLDLDSDRLGHVTVGVHVMPPRDPEQDGVLMLAGTLAKLVVGTRARRVLDVDQVTLGRAGLRGDRPAPADAPDLRGAGELAPALLARVRRCLVVAHREN